MPPLAAPPILATAALSHPSSHRGAGNLGRRRARAVGRHMGLLAFSDLVIASTLLVNSAAVLNFKIAAPPGGGESVRERGAALIASLRVFRVIIALWNVLVIVLMVIWFN